MVNILLNPLYLVVISIAPLSVCCWITYGKL